MHKTPTSVTVLAVIGIVLGGLGLCGTGIAAMAIFTSFGPPDPLLDSLRQDTVYRTFTTLSLAAGFAATILLIAASIASLQLRLWARKGMIAYAWIAIIQTAAGVAFNVLYVMPHITAVASAATSPDVRNGTISGLAIGGCGAVLGLIYPICVLYFYTRGHVILAFDGIFPADTAQPPAQPGTPADPNDTHLFP